MSAKHFIGRATAKPFLLASSCASSERALIGHQSVHTHTPISLATPQHSPNDLSFGFRAFFLLLCFDSYTFLHTFLYTSSRSSAKYEARRFGRFGLTRENARVFAITSCHRKMKTKSIVTSCTRRA